MLNGVFDTHAHYDDPGFAIDLPEVLAAQKAAGVSHIINCGYHLPSSRASVELAERCDGVYAAVGAFPLEAERVTAGWQEELEKLAQRPKVVAIGEIGLDYHSGEENRDAQKAVFRAQLELARRLDLPVEIHDRDADEDTLEMVREFRPRGVIHRFNSAAAYAPRFLALGLHLGIGPQITYRGADNLLQTVREMDLDKLLLETDCPFLPPAHLEGWRATSDMISFVAEAIAAARGDTTPQQIVDIARENGMRLFAIR